MKHERYFLISPKPELVARLATAKAADLMDLAGPVMWTGDEYDRSSFSPDDMDELVRMLFLDTPHREREAEESFRKVFDRWSISQEFFNTWWEFQRVDIDMSEEIAVDDAILTGSIDSLRGAVNDRVAEWLNFYRSLRR